MVEVTLTAGDIVIVSQLAALRTVGNRFAQVQDQKRSALDGLTVDMHGIAAEVAVARHYNVMPDLGIQPRSGSHDLLINGHRVDVKAATAVGRNLIATSKINPDIDAFILAETYLFPVVRIIGWAWAKDLYRPENLTDLGYGPTYLLRQQQLSPITQGTHGKVAA